MVWVGVDIGGTFTDAVLYDPERGSLRSTKVTSTPSAPETGVLDAVADLGVSMASIDRFRHGATVATNATLERTGAKLGVLTTAGFRDVLVVGRGNRIDLYDIKAVRPPGLVKRSDVIEVRERLGADGTVVTALEEADVEAAVAGFRERGVEAVVVCFLHAYANPRHEQRASEIIAARLEVPVCCSSDVLPHHREYERFATAALNAYVLPRMGRYLQALEARLAGAGLTSAPEILSSSGGSWPFARMARLPVNSMLSGPAAGVMGAVRYANDLGVSDLITYDMGGTSTDVALIRDGRYALAQEGQVGGLPNRAPQIEINTVGAGGGSIAYTDEGGFLNVGPRSAGAEPGPACYGRGGTEPTVTDANVVLGRFLPPTPLGGQVRVDADLANLAVSRLAATLGLEPADTAEGIVRIAVARMTGAIKEISVMRGIDPRDLQLLAYGGAGPLHAVLIARELGMSSVIVPALPGAFSAYGLLVAEPRIDVGRTHLVSLADIEMADIDALFQPLRESGRAALRAQGFEELVMHFEHALDMRYVGQAFELTTPFDPASTSRQALREAFYAVYRERYSQADDGEVEIVSFRVTAWAEVERPHSAALVPQTDPPAPIEVRSVRFEGEDRATAVYRRADLGAGAVLAGPLIVEEDGATTLVPSGARIECSPTGALIIEVGGHQGEGG